MRTGIPCSTMSTVSSHIRHSANNTLVKSHTNTARGGGWVGHEWIAASYKFNRPVCPSYPSCRLYMWDVRNASAIVRPL